MVLVQIIFKKCRSALQLKGQMYRIVVQLFLLHSLLFSGGVFKFILAK